MSSVSSSNDLGSTVILKITEANYASVSADNSGSVYI